jgi:mono/diheme cytochrome c family protein
MREGKEMRAGGAYCLSRIAYWKRRVACGMWRVMSMSLLASRGIALGAEITDVDLTKLPPPSKEPVSFARDIRPIFEQSCFQCHGPEKPKSGFRLDQREAALKGGENGVDIVPGDSTKSPLIYYVARIAPDIEMPPEGKGTPLTAEQVGK